MVKGQQNWTKNIKGYYVKLPTNLKLEGNSFLWKKKHREVSFIEQNQKWKM